MSSQSSAELPGASGNLSSAQSCPAAIDLGHVVCLRNFSPLQPAPSEGAVCVSRNQTPVYQALRAVAWCAGWRAANCSKGFGNNARCDEVLLAAACEDAETTGRSLGLTTRTIASLLEAIHSSAWHCANSRFGQQTDAQEDFDTAQKHWTLVRRGAELHPDAVAVLQHLVWCCCWCTANWRSGSDTARSNLKEERRHAQALGLSKKSAWAPHRTHHLCKREIAWKQKAVNEFLFSNSQVAIAERGGFKHHGLCVRRCAKRLVQALHDKSTSRSVSDK